MKKYDFSKLFDQKNQSRINESENKRAIRQFGILMKYNKKALVAVNMKSTFKIETDFRENHLTTIGDFLEENLETNDWAKRHTITNFKRFSKSIDDAIGISNKVHQPSILPKELMNGRKSFTSLITGKSAFPRLNTELFPKNHQKLINSNLLGLNLGLNEWTTRSVLSDFTQSSKSISDVMGITSKMYQPSILPKGLMNGRKSATSLIAGDSMFPRLNTELFPKNRQKLTNNSPLGLNLGVGEWTKRSVLGDFMQSSKSISDAMGITNKMYQSSILPKELMNGRKTATSLIAGNFVFPRLNTELFPKDYQKFTNNNTLGLNLGLNNRYKRHVFSNLMQPSSGIADVMGITNEAQKDSLFKTRVFGNQEFVHYSKISNQFRNDLTTQIQGLGRTDISASVQINNIFNTLGLLSSEPLTTEQISYANKILGEDVVRGVFTEAGVTYPASLATNETSSKKSSIIEAGKNEWIAMKSWYNSLNWLQKSIISAGVSSVVTSTLDKIYLLGGWQLLISFLIVALFGHIGSNDEPK